MKLRFFTLLFVFIISSFFSIIVCADEREFHFKMTHETITKDIINAYEKDTPADFRICIGDDGYSRVLMFKDGKTARLGYLTKDNWTTKDGEIIGINNSGYGEFRSVTIDSKKRVIIHIRGDEFYMYKAPSSDAAFTSEYNKLYQYLKSKGKLTVKE